MATKCKEKKTAKSRTANSKLQTFIIPNERLWPFKSTKCCNGPKKHEIVLVTERSRVVRGWVFVILFLILLNLSLISVLLDHSEDDTVWKSKRDCWYLVVINSDSMFVLIAAKWDKNPAVVAKDNINFKWPWLIIHWFSGPTVVFNGSPSFRTWVRMYDASF